MSENSSDNNKRVWPTETKYTEHSLSEKLMDEMKRSSQGETITKTVEEIFEEQAALRIFNKERNSKPKDKWWQNT